MNKRQQKKKVTQQAQTLIGRTATAIGSTLGAIARKTGIARAEPVPPAKAKRASRKTRTV